MAGWDDTMFGNLPRPRRPGQQRPLYAQDIVSGQAGPPQEARPYDDPTASGQLGQTFERGAEALGAPMSVQRRAGEIGSTVGDLSGLDMPQRLSDAWNYLRYGAPGQAALSAAAAIPVIHGAAAARTAEEIATGAKPAGIVAYHGSPYKFDRFSNEAIGTGEGAQVYGHGLYFAQNERVANSYRPITYGGRPVEDTNASLALDYIDKSLLAEKGGQAAVDDAISQLQRKNQIIPGFYDQTIADLKKLDPGKLQAGSMYQVRINAEPNQFLDWDRPLSEQPESIQAPIRKYWQEDRLPGSPDPLKGEGVYGSIASAYQGVDMPRQSAAEAASSDLRSAGIPGVKYLDQGSRGAGEGTRNFVVFDPATIEILKRYGLYGALAPVGAGAATLSTMGQPGPGTTLNTPPPGQGFM